MRTLNEVRILGHLGKDAETKFLPSGASVTNFSLATERRVKDGDEWKSETDWHNVVLWKGEKVADYLTKGKAVLVCGRLQTRSYEKSGEKRYTTEVVCDSGGIILCGGGDGGDRTTGSGGAGSGDSVPSRQAPRQRQITDDDIPF